MNMRDLPYRYVGYSTAILEALKFMIHPHLLDLAKGATIGYAILDIMTGLQSIVSYIPYFNFFQNMFVGVIFR